MAKFAFLFVLVALVAICNGSRIVREVPEAPKVPEAIQPLIDNVKNFLSENNLEQVKAQLEPIHKATEKLGKSLSDGVLEWFHTVVNDLEKKSKA